MAGSVLAADVFYENRLRAGREALSAAKYLDAAENLRIACFGMLDTPKSLSPCLAMLAVAQQGVGRTADLESTLSRFVEVETRFPSYASAPLDASLRSSFEKILRQRVPADTLATLSMYRAPQAPAPRPQVTQAAPPPVERPVVRNDPPPVVKPVITQPAVAQPKVESKPAPVVKQIATTTPPKSTPPVKTEVLPVPKVDKPAVTQRPVPQTTGAPKTARPVVKEPAPAQKPPAPQPAAAVKAPAATRPASTDPIGDARKLIADRKMGEATRLLETAVTQSPSRRDFRLALLQTAVFASDWPTALRHVEPLKPFREPEAAYAFYASVALFESNRRTEARALLTPVIPRLAHSSYVDNYVARITGK